MVLDPSAASFREELLRRGWTVYRAENEVLSGIRRTAELLRAGQLVICTPCEDAIREFGLYRWDTAVSGDRVVKEHDHAMDDIAVFRSHGGRPEKGRVLCRYGGAGQRLKHCPDRAGEMEGRN